LVQKYFLQQYPDSERLFSKMKVVNINKYDESLTLVMGGGGNSGILVGEKDVLVIDTKMMEGSKKLFDIVKEKANGKKINR
jgi:hypothetical protein